MHPISLALRSLHGERSLHGRPLQTSPDAAATLRRFTGQDFGTDAARWGKWLRANRWVYTTRGDDAVNETTIDDLHGRLVRDTLGRLNDQDAFLVFVLFHGYRVVLSAPVLTDRPGIQEVAALTQRCVSEALASAWAGTQDKRADPYFWYHRWNGEWRSYDHAEHLSPAESERLEQLRAKLERHPFVNRFEAED